MPQKSLISRLKRLTRNTVGRTGRSASRSGNVGQSAGEGLRILRPPEVGGRHAVPQAHDGGSGGVESTIDVVIRSALEAGVLDPAEVSNPTENGGFSMDWRTLCEIHPERSDTLRRLAAGIYGFKPVVISLVGTLVLADRLSHRIPREVWRRCYRLDCIPVLPHGVALSSTAQLTLACPDPARAAVRNLARSIAPGRTVLAYADAAIVDEVGALLAAELPHIAGAVGALNVESGASSAEAA